MWFKELVGFDEISPDDVRKHLEMDGTVLRSKVNGESYECGTLEIPTVQELREKVAYINSSASQIRVSECIANVQELHKDVDNVNALFQAASQFNLLEMVGPEITPESGVGRYQFDYTQGPACAIACGAGTIYRNYFVPVRHKIGQTSDNQIDCLEDIANYLNNNTHNLWEMRNGYALVSQKGLLHINKVIAELSIEEREVLKGKLKVGIQWDTEVTLNEVNHLVSQVYCSALPVAYSIIDFYYWESFARVILEATYEATLYAGLLNYEKTGCPKVYLTLVGGGAFGNETDWIIESLHKAILKCKDMPLNVQIVSYGSSQTAVRDLIKKLR
ncbi:hypothetical protein GCM10011344_10940 [Dokdonia pacifica]|uniref:Uncharacterized protein n=1 Tax=Dokdonia pacifica TaxID=1627892 RepID=A0A238YI72_9FLAO|nr:hypothetical protein [Dokdonia pacifica]GGG12087.1 hypothetical protein GCM10011344_10940 [Dokdonia pacifica]SNR70956.1 hypothetical protein SAMN06265376_102101 [Dokdonia pacifica]